jgi:ABC-type Co2+ transport system permease subunit
MICSHVCLYVLVSIGVGVLAYSPAIVLGLYASLRDGGATIKPAEERLNRPGQPKGEQ